MLYPYIYGKASEVYIRPLHRVNKKQDTVKMETAGYSGTPLAKKLGLKTGFKVRTINEPQYYFDLFSDLPTDLEITADLTVKKDFIHYFTKSASELEMQIQLLLTRR